MFLSFRWLLSLFVIDSPALALLVAGHIFHVADIFPEFIYPWFILAIVTQEKPRIVDTSEIVSIFLASTIISPLNGFKSSSHPALLYCNAVSMMIEG